jgi:serine protease Do
LAQELNVRAGEGVLVMDVVPKSPAAEAGVQAADVIVMFNGKSVKEPRELQELVERTPIGEERPLTVLRDGKQQTLSLVVKALPKSTQTQSDDEDAAEEEPASDNSYRDTALGLQVADLSAAEASQFDGQKGVLIQRVEPDSAAAQEGLRAGMLIRKVGRTTVTNVEEYADAVKKNLDKDGVLLWVRTGAGSRFVVVNPSEE